MANLVVPILIIPIVVGVVAVLIALGAQRVWEERRDGHGPQDLGIARLGSRWAEKVRAARVTQSKAPITPAQTHPPAVDGRPLGFAGPATRAEDELRRREAGPWAGPASGPVQPMLADSATSEPGGASSTEPHSLEPVWPDRASQKPAKKRRKRSTIAVDPLDAPLDPRHARVAAGGLIHDLEVEKIERPR